MRILASLIFVFAICTSATTVADDSHGYIGHDIEKLPLFDAHIHYKESAWSAYPPETVVKLMDDAGVAMHALDQKTERMLVLLNFLGPDND